MLGKIWKVVDWGSTGLGLVSGLVCVWALIFPGSAVKVLEAYKARFAAVEQTLGEVKEDTGKLVEAMATGVEMGGLSQSIGCPESVEKDHIDLGFNNHENEILKDAFVYVADANGQWLHVETGLMLGAGEWYSVELMGRARPARVCFGGRTSSGKAMSAEYSVLQWRADTDLCPENPNYGFQRYTAVFEAVGAQERALCRL